MDCTWKNMSIVVGQDSGSVDFHNNKNGDLVRTLDWTVTGTYSDWCGDFTGKIDVTLHQENVLMVPISS